MSASTHFTSPAALRDACRRGDFRRPTCGHAPGHLQANLMVLPREHAFDFLLFLPAQPTALSADRGARRRRHRARPARRGSNLATDVPGYRVYRDGGRWSRSASEVASLWQRGFS